MRRDQEKEKKSGKMEQFLRETSKKTNTMYLVLTHFKKKTIVTSMKVIGKMEICQEKEYSYGKMEK